LNKFSVALAAVSSLDSSLYNNTNLLHRVTQSLTVILLDSLTIQHGLIRIDIPDPSLAYVISVTDPTRLSNGSPVVLPLDSLVEGGSSIYVQANPTPTVTTTYRVSYLRTDSYSTFIGMLRSLMRSLRT
jgi:hypothetical protein